ncbi:MAG: hypothetical protein ACKVS6_04700 [Planctomycetota bacterium]
MNNNVTKPFYSNPSSVGFASLQFAFLSASALLLNEFKMNEPAARGVTQIIGGFALFVAVLFPIFVLLSPSPANGPKLLVFPVAATLALAPWIPPSWNRDPAGFFRIIFSISILGNILLLFVPAIGAGPPARGREIRWGAGGKLMLLITILAFSVSVVDLYFLKTELWVKTYRFGGIVTSIIFIYFLATRWTSSPGALLFSVVAAVAAAAAVLLNDRGPGVSQFFDSSITALSLMIGALYCASHVSKTSSFVWTFILILLMQGCSAAWPGFGPPLAAGIVMYILSAMMNRNGGGAALLAIALAALGFVTSTTWGRFTDWLDSIELYEAAGESFIIDPHSAAGYAILGIIVLIAFAGAARMIKNAAVLAGISTSVACFVMSKSFPEVQTFYLIGTVVLFIIVGGAIFSPRTNLIIDSAVEPDEGIS